MTRKDEDYLFDILEDIKDEVHENNVMLKSILKYLCAEVANSHKENEEDFGRNIIANMISTMLELRKIR